MSKWKIALLHGLLLILMSYFSLCAGYDYDYEDQKDAWGRCPWIRNRLKNGRVKVRSRGRIARFTCKSGYELVGSKFATCVRGQWNKPIPVCIAKGCPRIAGIPNGMVTEKYRGAQLTFDCNPGYNLQGDVSLFCDGSQWDKSAPTCEAASLQPIKSCDFEDPDLCGWSHDPTHDFDWRRHQFRTPSGHVGTGPSYDHTFGKGKAGYYMYEETSAPRNVNDTSRLFSPVFSSNNSPGCFVFWYHMYGSTIGRLRIYIKPESHVFVELTPVWEKSGDQGNQWLRGNVTIPPLSESFQVVIEGVRGISYLGDTAIDDVSLLNTNCSALDSLNATEGEEASGDSCRGRCHEQDNSTSCGCTVACESDNTCCSDYAKLCAEGNNEQPSGEDESATGKTETDSTPEDRVGTEYTATTPVLSTEFVTRIRDEPTVTENKSSSVQVLTPALSTESTSATTVIMNATTGASIIAPPASTRETTTVNTTAAGSPAPSTDKIINLTTAAITTEKTTTSASVVTVFITTAAPTTTHSTTSTTRKTTLTTPQVAVEGTTTVASTASVSNLTSAVSTAILSSTLATKPGTTIHSTTQSTTPPTTTFSVNTTYSTAETTSTNKGTGPVITVPAGVNKTTNTSTTVAPPTQRRETTSSKSTILTTTAPIISRVISTQSTPRTIWKTSSTTRALPTTSTKLTRPTSVIAPPKVSLKTVTTQTPTPRKITVPLVTLSTLPTYIKNRRTTKNVNAVSPVVYSAKSQTTTLDSLGDGTHALKSETVVPKSNSSSVIGASIGVIIIICLIGGVTFVFLRRRRQKIDKLHGDSIRFLPDNEVIEYSEASVTDSLFQS